LDYNTRNRKLIARKESRNTENYVAHTLTTECLSRHERGKWCSVYGACRFIRGWRMLLWE